MNKPLTIIAGPCAAESPEQIAIACQEASKRDIDYLRVNLWKPRTKPGFDGLGEKGLPLLPRVIRAGLSPALEVIMPEQAEQVLETVLPHLPADGKLLLWIGSRNQNHIVQRDIARVAAKDSRIRLMIKNQPWANQDHWEGIVGHVLSTGFPQSRLLNCHRGFAPSPYEANPLGLRNMPDLDMAMRLKELTDIPVIFDPSHIGGTVPNVLKMGKLAAQHDIDGLIIEVHHDPTHALTDQKQQLTWRQFDQLVTSIKQPNRELVYN